MKPSNLAAETVHVGKVVCIEQGAFGIVGIVGSDRGSQLPSSTSGHLPTYPRGNTCVPNQEITVMYSFPGDIYAV